MARGHGRILTSIWEDADFLALDEQQQRMYLFLISQPNLNHAGLLPLTLKRWARKARGLTVADVERTLAELAGLRFVVVDDDTEELLIRTFVRNDGVWRQPKVMAAMVSGAQEISSVVLRRALLEEMDNLPLGDLSDEPGARGPSVRQQIVDHLATLRRALRVPDPTPPPNPSRRVSDTPGEPNPDDRSAPDCPPGDTHSEGYGNPSESLPDTPGVPTTRAHAPASRAHSPAPAPAPAPAPSPVKEGGGRADQAPAAAAAPSRPDGRTSLRTIPDDFHLNDTMRRWAVAAFGQLLDPHFETEQFVSYWRSEGRRKNNWHDAWQKWMRDSAKRASERRAPGNVIQLPTGQTLTGTDAKVAGWSALTAQLRAQEARESS